MAAEARLQFLVEGAAIGQNPGLPDAPQKRFELLERRQEWSRDEDRFGCHRPGVTALPKLLRCGGGIRGYVEDAGEFLIEPLQGREH